MLLTILVVIVLWTWGLTPLWVNIVGSVLMFILFSIKAARMVASVVFQNEN
jgi:hypothetical protein